jgi:precorrin-3B synthase
MSAVKGWCPSLFAPMLSGDGHLLRIRPFSARISAAQARRIAGLAPAAIELTNRGNIQLRGLAGHQLEPLAQALLAANLAWPDPAEEARRNLCTPPLPFDDRGWIAALEAILRGTAGLAGKFGITLDRPDQPGPESDIRVTLAGDHALCRLQTGDAVAPASPAALARLVAGFAAGGHRRMRDAVAETGAAALLAAAGMPAQLDPAPPGPPRPLLGPLEDGFGLAPRFGVLAPAGLAHLADLAERLGDGWIRIAATRSLLIAGVADPEALAAALPAPWITSEENPWRGIVACPGSAGCASGQVATRADAETLLAGGYRPPPGLLHLSGCAKGCAHPAPAAAVLVGQAGRYALVRGGRAGDPPLRQGLTLAEAAAELEQR